MTEKHKLSHSPLAKTNRHQKNVNSVVANKKVKMNNEHCL